MKYEDIEDIVTESNAIEGIFRKPTDEEIEATFNFLELEEIRIEDVENLANVFANAPLRDKPDMNVRVGTYFPPVGGPKIREELTRILERVNKEPDKNSFQNHRDYQSLHPFMDGNGRTGRAIWWWQNKNCRLSFLQAFYYLSLNDNDR